MEVEILTLQLITNTSLFEERLSFARLCAWMLVDLLKELMSYLFVCHPSFDVEPKVSRNTDYGSL